MRIEVLQYILEIAREGSISKVAKQNHLQQTTLSAAVNTAETELGIKLFDRQHNGVVLTEAGQQIIENVQRICDEYQNLLYLLPSQNRTLEIAVNMSVYNVFCNDILPQIYALNTGYMFRITRLLPQQILNSGGIAWNGSRFAIDYYAGPLPDNLKETAKAQHICMDALGRTRLMLYLNRSHPLAFQEHLTLEELASTKMILGKQSRFLLKYLPDASILEGPDSAGVLSLVNRTEMATILPDYHSIPQATAEGDFTDIIVRDIIFPSDVIFAHDLYLLWAARPALNREEQLILNTIRTIFHRMYQP